MKDFLLKNKYYILLIFIILSIFIICKCFAMDDFQKIDFEYGIVNTDYLNLRSGVGINFDSIDLLTRNEYVRIYAKIGDWYIVQTERNKIGTVFSKYLDLTTDRKTAATNAEPISNEETKQDYTIQLTDDENKLLKLINEERNKNNLPSFKIDESLENTARLKAHDLVNNNYFAHISPTYGTPFEMLKSNGIQYKTASENIAGHQSVEKAFDSWISSEKHKENILSKDFNYTGIGVVDSIAYGKIIVELFIGK